MRQFFALALCVALCLALSVGASAAGSQVQTLTAQFDVQGDGSCYVKMTSLVYFSAPQNQFTVPLSSDADEVSVSGADYELDEIDGVTCIIFRRQSGFSGSISFSCSYRLRSVVTERDDGGQSVSIHFPEKGWDFSVNSYQIQVNFPCEITGYPSWYSAYYGVDIENYLDISIGERSLTARSLERLKDSETVCVHFNFAADTFDLRHMPGQTVSIATVLFYLAVVCVVGYRFFRLRVGRMQPIPRRSAVNESTAGEIPCQMFDMPADVFAVFAHWGNLGYLLIHRRKNGRILLCKQMEMGTERSAAERKLFYTLFRNGDTVDALHPRVHSASKTVGVMMRKGWARRLYRKETGSPFLLRFLSLTAAAIACVICFDLMLPASFIRWIFLPVLTAAGVFLSYLVQLACLRFYSRRQISALICGIAGGVALLLSAIGAGCVFTMLVSLAVQIFCGVSTMFGGERVQTAQQLVRQNLGLRSFLRTADTDALQRLLRTDGQYFYRMLPLADQLGVGSAFARRCSILQPEPCPWLIDEVSRPRTAPDFYAAYCQIAAAVRREFTFAQTKKTVPPEVSYG